MTPEEILALPSMPPGNSSYPRGPYRLIDREIFHHRSRFGNYRESGIVIPYEKLNELLKDES